MEKPSQWEKIKEIVGAALEREPGQRTMFVKEACAGDETLRAEVESLMSAHARADGLSESAMTTELADTDQVAKSLGPYRLLQKLGEGGMGQVWLAEQTEPVRRRVALKLIKAGMYDDSTLRRFQAERQSLAIMDHPAIAKVFDAGATPDGQPYFAMEYVPGVAITKYCDEKKLKIRERLELFIRACEGVQHAHQKAIIHRDLKPANILVVEIDGKPVPRIIDFGLAKAVTPYFSGESMNTQAGSFVGTPGYMSPEQADPGIQDVDTRSDVYSLGVVLYELLTGFLPFDATQWKKLRLEELLRHLRETDPPRPSTKVSAARDTAFSNAEARGTETGQLVSLLRGDLDWITMKALDKDRNRRYGTPSEIAADIRRYLNNEPIVARPASAGYRLQKYVRRHSVAVTVGAGVFVLLAGFAGLQAAQLRRITRERDRADRVAQFMTNMFNISDPSEARGNTITAREVLDKSAKEIDTGLAKDPELQGKLMDVIGTVYLNLGLYAPSQAIVSRSLEIKRAELGSGNLETLRTANLLAKIFAITGNFGEAEKLMRATLDTQRRVLGPEHHDTLQSMSNLANLLGDTGHDADAEKLGRQVVAIQIRKLGAENPETLTGKSNLGIFLARQGGKANFAESEQLNREVLDARRRTLGAEHPDTLRSMNNLALVLSNEGGHAQEAESMFRNLLEMERRIVGPEHPDTLHTMNNLANALEGAGHFVEAEEMNRQLREVQLRVLGPEHPTTLSTGANLASDLDGEHKYPEAEKVVGEVLEIQRRKLGTQHPDTLQSMYILVSILVDERRFADAEKLGRETLQAAQKVMRSDNAFMAPLKYTLAQALGAQGQREEALKLLRGAVESGLDPATVQGIEKDPNLAQLRGDPRFDGIVADARRAKP